MQRGWTRRARRNIAGILRPWRGTCILMCMEMDHFLARPETKVWARLHIAKLRRWILGGELSLGVCAPQFESTRVTTDCTEHCLTIIPYMFNDNILGRIFYYIYLELLFDQTL